MSQINFKITAKRYRYSVKFQHVIFPFTAADLMNTLARTNLGYVLSPPPPQGGNMSIGVQIEVGNIIGKKGNALIDFDALTQVLAIEGTDNMETIGVFSEIIDIIRTTLVPTIGEKALFYEIVSNHIVETGQNSIKTLGKQKFEGGLNESISNILEENISNYAIHVCMPSGKIDDPNWFDIHIQPFNRRPDVAFHVLAVYRKSEKNMVDKFAKTWEDKMKKLFELLSESKAS